MLSKYAIAPAMLLGGIHCLRCTVADVDACLWHIGLGTYTRAYREASIIPFCATLPELGDANVSITRCLPAQLG
jgi:hypothetical protein